MFAKDILVLKFIIESCTLLFSHPVYKEAMGFHDQVKGSHDPEKFEKADLYNMNNLLKISLDFRLRLLRVIYTCCSKDD